MHINAVLVIILQYSTIGYMRSFKHHEAVDCHKFYFCISDKDEYLKNKENYKNSTKGTSNIVILSDLCSAIYKLRWTKFRVILYKIKLC